MQDKCEAKVKCIGDKYEGLCCLPAYDTVEIQGQMVSLCSKHHRGAKTASLRGHILKTPLRFWIDAER